jgi:hypothetical protein
MKLSDIQKVVQKAVEPPAPPPITVVPAPAPRPARSAAAKRAGPTLSRVGKIHLSTYVHPDFKRSLRLIQAQTGESLEQLHARALNDLFRAHNVPVIDSD